MREVFGCLGLLVLLIIGGLILRVVLFPVTVLNNTVTVAQRIASADNMLAQYRWFHDADGRLKVFPAQIRAARANLAYAEKNAPDRASSRMTELTGITQVCEQLVGDYNARAQRLDAGFFRNPERWLPVATAPWEPLPQSYDVTVCEGALPQ